MGALVVRFEGHCRFGRSMGGKGLYLDEGSVLEKAKVSIKFWNSASLRVEKKVSLQHRHGEGSCS